MRSSSWQYPKNKEGVTDVETKQQNKANGRKTMTGTRIAHPRAGGIVALLVLGAGTAAGVTSL